MIQRIQTVYLALALIFLGLLSWLPMGEIAANNEVYSFSIKGLINTANQSVVLNGLPLIILLVIIEIIQVFIIFLYKNRIRQIRLATLNLLLMLGLFGVSMYFMHSSANEFAEPVKVYKVAMAFPLVAAIFNYLGIRAIGKDEALIRSIDRIR